MVALLDDEAVVRRIFEHLDNDTTDLSTGTWTEPVENYRSPDRLSAEIEVVLRRCPTLFCPSVALAETGSYVAREAGGVPLLAVRGRDGTVRAFRNACRHRGTALVQGAGCEKALVCPYHGWVYSLDGALRHVPDGVSGFPDLDRTAKGLVPVRATESGGCVFVTQDEPVAGSSPGSLPELVADGQELLGSEDVVLDANWKVLLEGFVEGYHLKATHRETFLPFGYDNVTVVETFGPHSRVTFPFRRIETLRDLPSDQWAVAGVATVVHHIFPNAIVARLSHHTTVVVLEPLTVDTTRLVTYRLANRPSGVGPQPGAAERDAGFVLQGAAEDLAVARAVQHGLASGANEVLTFGRFEGAIGHLHRQLHELVDSAGPHD